MADIHAIETQLLGWTKSTSKRGPSITLLLQDDADIEWFEALTLAKGKTAGQLLDVAFQLSDQDDQKRQEQPQDLPKTAGEEKHKGGILSMKAAMLCDDPTFCRYVELLGHFRSGYKNSHEMAAAFIRLNCGIPSRSELDHNEVAAKLFATIRTEFANWKREVAA